MLELPDVQSLSDDIEDLSEADLNGAKPDDLAVCEILDSRTMRNRKVRVLEVIGNRGDINAISNDTGLYHFGVKAVHALLGHRTNSHRLYFICSFFLGEAFFST